MPKSPAKTPPAPKRGRVPTASSFRLVAEDAVSDVLFGSTRGRESVYLKALQDLAAHPGRLMEVDNLSARSGIANQARKHGITVLFGEGLSGGSRKLYVKVMARESPEDLVLKRLQDGPLNLVEIESLPYPM